MEVAKHTHAAVIVSSEWQNVGAVKLFIGASDNPNAFEDERAVSWRGKSLTPSMTHGLWIELDGGQRKWADRPAQKLMVPWKFALAILLQPDFKPHENKVGYETSEPVPA